MIVKCERCQTRFKIPDEKVTDKGVKVRCTKCQHTFRVAREDASSATPTPAVPSPEGAARPPAPPRAGTPLEVPKTSAPPGKAPGRPGGASGLDSLFDAPGGSPAASGVATPRGGTPAILPRLSSLEPPKTPGTIELDPLLEFMGENTPTPTEALKLAAKAAVPNKPAGALALGPAQPKPAVPASKPAQGAAPVPVQVPARRPAPAPVPAKSPVPVPAKSPTPAQPVSSAPPAPKPAQGAAPVPVQVPARSPAPAQPGSRAPMSFEENDPFALPPDDAPTAPATPTLPPRSAAPAPVFEEMEGLEGNNPFVSFEAAPTIPATPTLPPAPAPKPARSAAPVPVPAAAPNEMEGLDGDNPFASFDPVAALPPASAKGPAAPNPAPAASGIPDWGAPPQGSAPAGIPDWGATQTVAATPIAKANAPTERNPFPDFPGPGEAAPGREVPANLPAPKPTPAPPVIAAQPPKKEEAAAGGKGSRLVQRLAGVAAQLVLVAVLVVGLVAVGSAWLNDGRVELSAVLSPPPPLLAKDLSNGLYELRDGRTLFFVRGEVENRGPAPTRVKAEVVMYDGDQRVKSAEGLVGAVPTAEELHALGNASEADALRARLDAAAREVAPGARAPFIVIFYEYPSDLAGFRLEVTLEPHAAVATGGAKEGTPGNARP